MIFIMKKFIYLLFFLIASPIIAQVGINTDNPQGQLDVVSNDSGVLFPRIELTSLTTESPVINPNGGSLQNGTVIYNTGASVGEVGLYIWNGNLWAKLVDDSEKRVAIGKFRITATGSLDITGLPFQPSSIEFRAINNVENYNAGLTRFGSSNVEDKKNNTGVSFGYARNVSGAILQQVITGAISGASTNRSAGYSSNTKCIALQFIDQEAVSYGRTSASLTNFNSDGFTLNVTEFTVNSVVMFTAYK
jgi:hypothetical protein